MFTVARRDTQEKMEVSADIDIASYVLELMDNIQNNLFIRARKRRDEMTYEAQTVDEMREIIENHPGFIIADWCGDQVCEEALKEVGGLKSRCILEGEPATHKCVVCGRDAKHKVVWGIQY